MAHWCESCGHTFTNPRCPRCGGLPQSQNTDLEEHGPEPVVLLPDPNPGAVSDPDATLDTMIETASRPTLATLLKRGVESGLITPTQEYSAGQVRT